jgi:hypothetical protein
MPTLINPAPNAICFARDTHRRDLVERRDGIRSELIGLVQPAIFRRRFDNMSSAVRPRYVVISE